MWRQIGIALVVMASLQACAVTAARPAPALEQTATLVPPMLGINDGPAVPPRIVARYCGYAREFIVRAPIQSTNDAIAAVDTIAACPRLHSLWLVEKNDLALVTALAQFIQAGVRPPPWGIELGNERDLAGDTPEQFGAFVGTARQILRDAGYRGRIVIGAVYTVDDHQPQDFQDYLAPAMEACPDCDVALHWYGDTSSTWLSRVQHLGRAVLVTEFGMPSCTPAQDAAQDAYLHEKRHDYARAGNVLAAIVYQRNSAAGPCDDSDASHLRNFGLQRPPAPDPDPADDDAFKSGESIFTESDQ